MYDVVGKLIIDRHCPDRIDEDYSPTGDCCLADRDDKECLACWIKFFEDEE